MTPPVRLCCTLSACSGAVAMITSCVLLFSSSAHALEVPVLKGYVNDYADMISPAVEGRLEGELRSFEQTDSTQIVILTIPSLEGEAIEEFSIKVGETWKIGQALKDNGIIFIAAKEDRKMRIEVGRGLEGRLTDLTAGRIIDLVVKPAFKRGDFDYGFLAAVAALIDATRGEFTADQGDEGRVEKGKDLSPVFTFLLFGAVFLLVLGTISRILGAAAGAIGLPAVVHLIVSPLGIVSLILLAVLGFASGLLLPLVFSSRGFHRRGGGYLPGVFYGTGRHGGFGGGTFGGGGFSGGGGGFGGGGASGDW